MSLRFQHLMIALAILLAEFGVAFSGVPFVRGFVSDFLVVMLLFHLIKAVRDLPRVALALGVFIFAFAVEVAQYFHLADVLGFARGSLPGILLGNTFSAYDVLMYCLGCVTACLVDAFVLGRRPSSRSGG